jgi:hypothetical protein
VWTARAVRSQPQERSLAHRQEDARTRLSRFLILAIGAEIVWAMVSLSTGHTDFNTVKDVMAITFTPLIVLLTAITNFYLPK